MSGSKPLRLGPRELKKRVSSRQEYNRKRKQHAVRVFVFGGGLGRAGTTCLASNLVANGLAVTHERGNPSSPYKVRDVSHGGG